MFEDHIEFMIQQKNNYSNLSYKDDPTIMAWELGNEPRGVNNQKNYLDWIDKTSSFIKKLDPNHLVTIGSEGNTSAKSAGNKFKRDHDFEHIDYTCIHIWIQNFSWFDPANSEKTFPTAYQKALDYFDLQVEQARELNKPLVLEEFGCPRDSGSYDPQSLVTIRNRYFNLMFEKCYSSAKAGSPVAGCNFWAWSGNSTPFAPYGSFWKQESPYLGDPPHEPQGWYGVYSTDYSTLAIIKEYATKMTNLTK